MKLSTIIICIGLAATALSAQARDTKLTPSIKTVLDGAEFKSKDNGIKLHFGSGHATHESMGDIATNKKTNAFNKSDEEACQWVMLSALIQLQEKARQMGGKAVVNIRSYYKKDDFISSTEYECHAGAFSAGVALKGTVIK